MKNSHLLVIAILLIIFICLCSICIVLINFGHSSPSGNGNGDYVILIYAYTSSPVKNTNISFLAEYMQAKNVISFPSGQSPTPADVQNRTSLTPVANFPITIVDKSDRITAEGKTDSSGHLMLNFSLKPDDKIIVPGWQCQEIKKWSDSAIYICLQNPDPNSVYAFNPSF